MIRKRLLENSNDQVGQVLFGKKVILILTCFLLFYGILIGNDNVFPGKKWAKSIPENQGIDSEKLIIAIKYLDEKFALTGGINSLVLVRNGYIIYNGDSTKEMHCIWSCSKSFTSTVLGLLIDNGKCSLGTLAKDHVKILNENYPDVTLRHFATMTSGYDAKGGRYKDDPDDGSITPLEPTIPVFAPGTKYSYFDDAVRMNGYVLTMIAGTDLESYFKEKIAKPIGMDLKNFSWDIYPENDKRFSWDNSNNADVRDAAGGIYITPLDFARFGYLFLNKGKWNGKQLISRKWIEEATSVHVPIGKDWRNDTPRQNGHGIGRYGFNWWLNTIGKDGKRSYTDAPPDLYWASGYNNNKCFIIPEWNMVIVRMGVEGTPPRADTIWNEFLRLIGEAILIQTPGNKK